MIEETTSGPARLLASLVLWNFLLGAASAGPGAEGGVEGDSGPARVEDIDPRVDFDLAPVATDRTANEHQASTQDGTALARDGAGRTLVVWQSRRQQTGGTYGVYGRLFGADGEPLTGELPLNADPHGNQTWPCVDFAPDGTAWAAWESFETGTAGSVIVARRLAADLDRASHETLVSLPGGHAALPSIVATPDGGAWVAWSAPRPATAEHPASDRARRILLARLAPDASLAIPPFTVDEAGAASDGHPALALAPGPGGEPGAACVCIFARTDLRGVPSGVYGRVFDPEGRALGATFALSETPGAIEPALGGRGGEVVAGWSVPTADGGYAARWRRFTAADGDPSLGAIHALDEGLPAPSGDAPEARLADELPALGGHLSGLALDLDARGRTLVVWTRFCDAADALGREPAGLFGRFFDEDGAPLGPTFRVTATAGGHQRLGVASGAQRLALDDDGTFAAAWSGSAGGSDSSAAAWTLARPPEGSVGGDPAHGRTPGYEAGHEAGHEAASAATSADGVFGALEAGAARPHVPPLRVTPVESALGAPTAPTPGAGFPGVPQTTLTPPDPQIAVGPAHLVAVVNDGLRFYDASGALTFSSGLSFPQSFFAPAGNISGLVFDPETLYDTFDDRFVVMANQTGDDGKGYFLLAMSDDSNPNGAWNHYRFDITSYSGDPYIDSPNVSVDANWIYLSADFPFVPPSSKHLVFTVKKSSLGSGGPLQTGHSLLTNVSEMGLCGNYDANPVAQYMIESFPGTSNKVELWAIQNPLNPQFTSVQVTVPSYSPPEDPPQMGTTVRPETFEARFWSAVSRNGSIWATHHVNTSRVRQRWYEFDLRGWPASGQTPILRQSGEIDLGPSVRTFGGSLAVDAQDNVALTFSRSSPSEFISMRTALRFATDPLGSLGAPQLAQASTAPDFSGRWGDYSDIEPRPDTAGSFWAHGEFTTGTWSTWIQPVTLGPVGGPVFYCTPKTSSAGCVTTITTSAPTQQPVSGADDYAVIAEQAQGLKPGLFLFGGSGPASISFQGGVLCVKPPLGRTPLAFTGGASGACNGGLYRRINNPNVPYLDGGPGSTRWLQAWYRDPGLADGFGVVLSDAVQVDFL